MLIHSEKMNALGQLVAGVAHEINNPIAFVYSNVCSLEGSVTDLLNATSAFEQLIDANGTESMRASSAEIVRHHDVPFIRNDCGELFRASLDGLGRVKKIVEDLRTFSRLDEAELKTVDVAECVRCTVAIARPELSRHNVTVEVSLDHLPPITCFASELSQVFLNLIVNAAQAMAEGGTLSIRGKEEDDWLVLEFADTGHGIPPEIQSKIFDPFFTTKPVGQGTGLGLSLVYKIITERHHGVIQVASPNHQGATFTIRIPKQQEPDHE